jgi:hypothetical protein
MDLHLALKANRNVPSPRGSPSTEIAAPARQKFPDALCARGGIKSGRIVGEQ